MNECVNPLRLCQPIKNQQCHKIPEEQLTALTNDISENEVWLNKQKHQWQELTCVSMIWNISGPFPARRLGILMSIVEPGSLLGPLFITYTNSTWETDLNWDLCLAQQLTANQS